jgi:peptidoglycan/LPS O-acetylase OafA/YrhL
MPSTKMLAELAVGRGNNLNAIRLLLSVMVLFSHSYPLALGEKADPFSDFCHGEANFGSFAVDLFFFISGMLITSSWFNSRTVSDYLRRRILRIYPGYFCGLAFGFLAALVFADHQFAHIFSKLGKFSDAFLLGVGGVFGDWIFLHNPFPCYANGSLWTIQWEFICYLIVAVIGLWGCFKYRRGWLAVLLGAMACYVLWHLGDFHWRLTIFFLAGMCVWLWRDKIPIRRDLALAALAFFVAAACWPHYGVLPMELMACYLVLWCGYAIQIPPMAWTQKADLSYGVYLYAFPIQQIVAAFGVRTPWIIFVTATPFAMLLATASWFLIEKPCLSLKSCHFSDWDPGAVGATNSAPPVISPTEVSSRAG